MNFSEKILRLIIQLRILSKASSILAMLKAVCRLISLTHRLEASVNETQAKIIFKFSFSALTASSRAACMKFALAKDFPSCQRLKLF